MTSKVNFPSRRAFLRGSDATVAGAAATAAANAAEPDPLITEVQDWATALTQRPMDCQSSMSLT